MKQKIIIDIHAHLGYWPTLKECKNNILNSTKENKINFTLLSFDGTEFQDEPFKDIDLKKANDITLNFVKSHKGFGMLIWIKPTKCNYIEYLDEFINQNRKYVYGLKFHPFLSRLKISDKKLKPYFNLAIKYGLPVLVHTALDKYSTINYIEKVATKYPNINFIAAHMELTSDHKYSIGVLKKYPNVYGDTAWVDSKILNLAKKEKVLNKILFGTDNPIDGERTLKEEIYQKYINNYKKLSNTNYALIMQKNAQNLFNIDENDLKKY